MGELNLVVVWRSSLVQLLVEWHQWQHLVVFFSILMLISEKIKIKIKTFMKDVENFITSEFKKPTSLSSSILKT